MFRIRVWSAVVLVGLGLPLGAASAQPVESSVEARVWLDRGDNPVLDRGDRVRVYYRTSADSYLAIFHIDTNGAVSLLFPASPEADHFVRGGMDYRLLFPRASHWFVDEDPGVGYFFILASPTPLDFREFRYSWAANGWDLSFVGRSVYDDPFVAMDEYIARLIPDWEYADYALDWVEYNVGEQHEYPRFLCYDCHGFSPYSAWNPYLSACTSFRVVIYDDPWYYPVNRYRGTSVVYVRPPVWRQPRYVFKERAVGEPWAPIVRPRPSDGGIPGVPGDVAPRRSGAGIGSGGTVPPVSRPARGARGTERLVPRTRPTRGAPTYDPRQGAEPDRRGSGTPSTRSGGTPAARIPATGAPATRAPTTRGDGAPAARVPTTRNGGNGTADRNRPTQVRPPATGGSGAASTRSLPTLRRRPDTSGSSGTTGGSAGTPTRSSGGGSAGTVRGMPTVRPRPSGGSRTSGGVTRTPTRRSGGSGSVIRIPSARSSGGGVSRTPTRSSGGSVQRAPTRRSGGSVTRTPPRSSGGTVQRAPTRRSGGSVTRTPPRSSGGSASRTRARRPSASPPTRSRTPAATRTPPRSSGGSARPPARGTSSRKPPVRRKPGGGDAPEA